MSKKNMGPFQVINVRGMLAACLALAGLSVWAGCGNPEARFKLNEVAIIQEEQSLGEEIPETGIQDISDALAALLGTPDAPNLPAGLPEEVAGLLDLKKLQHAAGPVVADESGLTVSGLYREHCAHCHGLSGDGAGPTAPFLNPYPRDYRPGEFKFKSTPIGFKPTDSDLHRILNEGIMGTAMPSFKLLQDNELEALVQYVKYLSIRGQVEKALIQGVAYEEYTPSRDYLIDTVLLPVMESWVASNDAAEPVPPPSDDFDWEHAIERGEELYYSTAANCFSCHGPTQLGDGQRGNYDNWTTWAVGDSGTLKPESELAPFLAAGALPPRPIIPRNLRQGMFRFGRRPADIYMRIWHGIEGTPMPAKNDAVVTSDDVWYLVQFVRSLQYQPLSEPEHYSLENMRERM